MLSTLVLLYEESLTSEYLTKIEMLTREIRDTFRHCISYSQNGEMIDLLHALLVKFRYVT